jgi:hypothetical protein
MRQRDYRVFESQHAEQVATIRAHAGRNHFLSDLVEKLERFGSLSDRQLEVGVRVAGQIDQRHEEGAHSQYIGEKGQRHSFHVECVKVIALEPREYRGRMIERNVYLFNEVGTGNRVVYFGTSNAVPTEGTSGTFTAMVKDHSERDGCKQTIVNFPKFVSEDAPAAGQPEPDEHGIVEVTRAAA